MKLEFSRQIFEIYSHINVHENPSSGSRVVLCGQMDGRTDITKLIVPFRNFANSSNYIVFLPILRIITEICEYCLTVSGSESNPDSELYYICTQ